MKKILISFTFFIIFPLVLMAQDKITHLNGRPIFVDSRLNTIGGRAGFSLTLSKDFSGSKNTFFGTFTGDNNKTGNNNTFLGYGTGFTNITGSGNVFLGYEAGYNERNSNKLYISNSSTYTPLIYGDFSQKVVTVNGNLGIGTQDPESAIHLKSANATFRIDGGGNDPNIAIRSYSSSFKSLFKSFSLYTKGISEYVGKFVIADHYVMGKSNGVRFVIANNGYVGIGDFLNTDPSEKLTVSGNVLTTGSYITSD